MRKVLLILFLFVSVASVGQVITVRVPDSTTAFGMNLPRGTEVYDLANKMAWRLDVATASTTTLQTATKTRINNEGILRIFADAPYSAYITTNSDRAKEVILTADSGLMGTVTGNEFKIKNTNPFPGFGTSHATAAYGDHNHSGVYQPAGTYDYYGYWTLYLAGLTTIQLTSLNNLVYSPGTGITLGYQYSGGLNYVTFTNSAPFPGFGTSHSTSAYGDHNHSGVYLESEVDGSKTNEGILSFADSSGFILLKSNTSPDRIRFYGNSGISLKIAGSTNNDRYIDVSGSNLVPYTGASTNVNLGNYSLTAKKAHVTDSLSSTNFTITKEGGYAIKMIAGCDLEQGDVVRMGWSDGTVTKTISIADSIHENNAVGVVYANASASASVWVVTSGKALVKFSAATECEETGVTCTIAKRGYLATIGYRTCFDGENTISIGQNGKAVSVRVGWYSQTIGIITETKEWGESAYVILSLQKNIAL